MEGTKMKIIIVEANDNNTFKFLYDKWAMTWEGLVQEDFITVLKECYEQDNSEQVMIGYWIKGKVMNDHYKLTGDNRYPDDLNIFAIVDYGYKLALHYGARWFTDIVDNNERREKEVKR